MYVCVCVPYLQAAEVFSRARRYNEKVDMFSLTVMISEIITSYMVPVPRRYLADEVIDMVDAAIAFLEPLCPAMVPLLRAGFSDVPAERPSAVDMLTVLNSAEVLAALAASAPVAPAAAAAAVVRARVLQLFASSARGWASNRFLCTTSKFSNFKFLLCWHCRLRLSMIAAHWQVLVLLLPRLSQLR